MSKNTIDYQIFDLEGIDDAPKMLQDTRRQEAAQRSKERIEAQRRAHDAQMELGYLMDTINRNALAARDKSKQEAEDIKPVTPKKQENPWKSLIYILGIFLLGVAVAGILAWIL